MRTVSISKCMNGYIVQVGCQTLVFNYAEAMLGELDKYLKDPEGVEKAYTAKYGLVGGLGDVAGPRVPEPPENYSLGNNVPYNPSGSISR